MTDPYLRPKHNCKPPNGRPVGTTWTCECGKIWRGDGTGWLRIDSFGEPWDNPKNPPDRWLKSAPKPSIFAERIEHIERALPGLKADFFALYPSGYLPGRKDTGERTRRSVGGVSGDVSTSLVQTQEVKFHLDSMADFIDQARALVLRAETEAGKAMIAIEKSAESSLVAEVVAKVDRVGERELEAARGAQRRRGERAAEFAANGHPFAMDEVTG